MCLKKGVCSAKILETSTAIFIQSVPSSSLDGSKAKALRCGLSLQVGRMNVSVVAMIYPVLDGKAVEVMQRLVAMHFSSHVPGFHSFVHVVTDKLISE